MGVGEAFRYVVIHPGKHDFEAKNPGALFVALSRAKSAGGEGSVIAEILEVANNPNLNKNRGSTVRGDR